MLIAPPTPPAPIPVNEPTALQLAMAGIATLAAYWLIRRARFSKDARAAVRGGWIRARGRRDGRAGGDSSREAA
jgi:hypothetical protein